MILEDNRPAGTPASTGNSSFRADTPHGAKKVGVSMLGRKRLVR